MSRTLAIGRRLSATSTLGAWLLVAAWVVIVFVLLTQPDADAIGGRRFRIGISAVAHGFFFCVLGFLAANAVIPLRIPRARWWIVVALTLYGIAGELVQSVVPGRTPSLVDLGADALGAFSGAVIWTALARWHSGATPRRSVRLGPDRHESGPTPSPGGEAQFMGTN